MKGGTVLDRIVDRVRARVEEAKLAEVDVPEDSERRRPHDFREAFPSDGVHIIAEVKLASPSEGDIAPGADPLAIAADYLKGGASAISVLTERDHFKGSPGYLRAIREAHPEARLLMKDFVVDEFQLRQASRIGADAVLLIVALLGEKLCRSFMLGALSLGLTPLVEVHDEEEMRIASGIGARLIGVNNRNLKTLEVSLSVSERLAGLAPGNAVLIAESGLRTGRDLRRLRQMGYRGFLIGTSFMKSGAPGLALERLLEEASE